VKRWIVEDTSAEYGIDEVEALGVVDRCGWSHESCDFAFDNDTERLGFVAEGSFYRIFCAFIEFHLLCLWRRWFRLLFWFRALVSRCDPTSFDFFDHPECVLPSEVDLMGSVLDVG
jgi:hypothetical protein